MGHQPTPSTIVDRKIPPAPILERDAARHIGMSVAYLRQARRQGRGPAHFRLGRAVRYRIADLDTWLSAHRVNGNEDPTLTNRLATELPGILLWGLEGWTRLQERGHFVQPASANDALQDLEDLASPIRVFIRECCTTMPEVRTNIDTIYAAWDMWCRQDGRHAGTKQMFGRNLAAAFPSVVRKRGTGQVPFYMGINLKSETADALDLFLSGRTQQVGRQSGVD